MKKVKDVLLALKERIDEGLPSGKSVRKELWNALNDKGIKIKKKASLNDILEKILEQIPLKGPTFISEITEHIYRSREIDSEEDQLMNALRSNDSEFSSDSLIF